MVIYDIGMADIRKLDPQTLLVFESLLETGSTTLSASRLGLSQSAVSGALRRLREIFDDPLFERHSRGLTPTLRANELSVSVAQILGAMRSLSASLEFDPSLAQGTVSVLATDYALSTIIAPIRDRLSRVAPGLTLLVQAYTGEDVVTNSTLLSTDLLIGSPIMLPDTLQSRHLMRDELVLFMAADHPLASKDKLTMVDLTEFPHVLVSLRGRSSKGEVDSILAEHGLVRMVDTITPSFLSLQTLVGNSERLTVAPRSLDNVTNGALVYKQLPFPLPHLELYAAWHKRFTEDKRHIWLRRTLTSWIKSAAEASRY